MPETHGVAELVGEMRSRLTGVTDINEPDIYRPDGPHSFVADLAAAAGVPAYRLSPTEAAERLARHSKYEDETHAKAAGESARRQLGLHGIQARGGEQGAQSRALSSTVPGSGGSFAPPKYLVDKFAGVARAACPLRGLVSRLDLPPGTMELHTPRWDTTGGGVVPQQVENMLVGDELSQSDQIVSEVATFSDGTLMSQQMFDRGSNVSDSGLMQVFGDSFGQSLSYQLMNGTGSGGQLLGLLAVTSATVNNVPGMRVLTYTDVSPTPTKIIQAISQCAGQISDVRLRAPGAILMRGSRWFALAGTPDGSTNEPVQRPGTGVAPADSDTGPYGPLSSLNVWHDNTIPANLGSGSNQDVVVLCRPVDILLLEDPLGPRLSAFPASTTAGELAVSVVFHHYVGAVVNRWPSGIGVVTGTGMVVPQGF